jgi:L-lysine exporter family protein LysE/ArgO
MKFLEAFAEGFLTGIGLSLMLGTVFFSIIQNSAIKGYKYGVLIALGVIVSDIMFISLALWSSTFAEILENHGRAVTWFGATLLTFFGLSQFFRKVNLNRKVKEFNHPYFGKLMWVANGFFLNVINPVNFFIWLSISTMLSVSFEFSASQKIYFFCGSLFAIFMTESTLAFFSGKIQRWMNEKRIVWVNRISGSVFVAIAIYLALTA